MVPLPFNSNVWLVHFCPSLPHALRVLGDRASAGFFLLWGLTTGPGAGTARVLRATLLAHSCWAPRPWSRLGGWGHLSPGSRAPLSLAGSPGPCGRARPELRQAAFVSVFAPLAFLPLPCRAGRGLLVLWNEHTVVRARALLAESKVPSAPHRSPP